MSYSDQICVIFQLNYNISPFCESGVGLISSRWEEWRDQFIAYLDLKGISDVEEKHKALLCFGGPDERKIAKDVAVSGNLMDNAYRSVLEALDNYYAPRMTLRYERFKFRQMTFNPKKKLDQFVVRLRAQAAVCSFGDQSEDMIMDQIVYATQTDDKLRSKYLEVDTSLDEMLKIGRTHETVNKQVQEFRSNPLDSAEINTVDQSVKRTKPKLTCGRCLGNHLASDTICPARESQCNRCNKKGHYARCCRSVKNPVQNHQPTSSNRKRQVHDRDHGNRCDQKPKFVREVDDVTKTAEIRELFHLNGKRTTILSVGGVNLRFIVDTGADEDVLSIADWTTLKRIGFEAFAIRKESSKIFQAYGTKNPLTVLGEVDVMLRTGNESCRTTLFVIQDGKHSLLSGRSAETLGVVKFLRSVSDDTFPAIKDMCASIKIYTTVPPVIQSYRRIPIPLEEVTILKLKELERQGVIERVYEASEWVSPMLVKRKNSNDVRIIIALREANKAVVREVHPLPTMEQMTAKLRGSKVFGKLDIKQAFHQLLLREDCRYITTFISPLGKNNC
ncbi:uncharacterized protein K02A2.6-like isoform X3 [Aedes albopictus]|uniref:CCHC-type domain-containing protein n=1 Tax=Aedes albopictus TaxID=7160 RepID=A0ABM1Y0R4_AEDAL